MQAPSPDNHGLINKRNSEGSLDSLFGSAYEFLAVYSSAKIKNEETFTFHDDGETKSAYTEEDVEMINWWLTYSKTGKKLLTLLGQVEKRIPIEGVPAFRAIGGINHSNISSNLHDIFISTLFKYHLSGVMNNIDISRERKEKAIILFRKLGFNTKLGTDQERESVRRRLGEAMQFDELI